MTQRVKSSFPLLHTQAYTSKIFAFAQDKEINNQQRKMVRFAAALLRVCAVIESR